MKTLIFAFFLLFVTYAQALGGCNNTSQPAQSCTASILGKVASGSHDLFYCDGSIWRKFGGGTTGVTCTAGERRMRMSAGQLQVCCLFDNIYYTPTGFANGSCLAAQAGKLRLVGAKMQYCNGTDWFEF